MIYNITIRDSSRNPAGILQDYVGKCKVQRYGQTPNVTNTFIPSLVQVSMLISLRIRPLQRMLWDVPRHMLFLCSPRGSLNGYITDSGRIFKIGECVDHRCMLIKGCTMLQRINYDNWDTDHYSTIMPAALVNSVLCRDSTIVGSQCFLVVYQYEFVIIYDVLECNVAILYEVHHSLLAANTDEVSVCI